MARDRIFMLRVRGSIDKFTLTPCPIMIRRYRLNARIRIRGDTVRSGSSRNEKFAFNRALRPVTIQRTQNDSGMKDCRVRISEMAARRQDARLLTPFGATGPPLRDETILTTGSAVLVIILVGNWLNRAE